MERSITDEAEAYLRGLPDERPTPHPHECLACYLHRALDDGGCAGDLALAGRYRDAVAPRAGALERRLGRSGGYCDCEVLANAMQPAWHLWSPRREVDRDDETIVIEAEPPKRMPRCTGVRRGSTQPCRNWHLMWRPSRR